MSAEIQSALVPGSQMGVHFGHAYLMIANRYPTLLKVILEAVQNALDASASKIWITVNQRHRSVYVRDNGNGSSRENFELSLAMICKSQKEDDRLGRFGIGVISPLGKCEYFTFTSCAVPQLKAYLQWKFVTEDIEGSEAAPTIPVAEKTNLEFGIGSWQVPWRTEVAIFKFARDEVVSNFSLSDLKMEILDRFGQRIRRQKCALIIKMTGAGGNESNDSFTSTSWTGIPFPEYRTIQPAAGRVTVRLFRKQRIGVGKPKGRIVVGEEENDFRITFEDFSRTAGRFLDAELTTALKSGRIEGELTAAGIRCKPERDGFIEDLALQQFCSTLNEWYEEKGKDLISDEEGKRDADRWQALGRRAMEQVEQLLQAPQSKGLLEAMNLMRRGIGSLASSEVADVKVEGTMPQENPDSGEELPKVGEVRKRVPQQSIVSGETRKVSPPTLPADSVLTVAGPRGRTPRTLQSPRMGIAIMHEPMEGEDNLYRFRREDGTLRFNVRHPIWELCDRRQDAIVTLQVVIIIQVLILESAKDDEWRQIQKRAFDAMLTPLAPLLLELMWKPSVKKASA